MSQPEGQPPRPHWTTLSVVLVIIGLLILVPSGLCTGLFGIGAMLEGGSPGESLGILLIALLYGAVPIAIGGVLVYAGLQARRKD